MFKLTMKGLLLLTCVSLVGCVEDTEMWNNGYSAAPNNSVVVTRTTTTTTTPDYNHHRRHESRQVIYNAPGVTPSSPVINNSGGYDVSGSHQDNSGYSVH